MQKVLSLAAILLIFAACSSTPEFPFVDPQKPYLSTVTDGFDTLQLACTYEDKRLTSLYISHRNYEFTYEDGQVSRIDYALFSYPETYYNFDYQDDVVTVTHFQRDQYNTVTRTIRDFYFEAETDLLQQMEERTEVTLDDGTHSLRNQNKYEFSWDEDGKNIIEQKEYWKSSFISGPSDYELLQTTFFTYDENRNPFFGLGGFFLPNLAEYQTFCQNNISSRRKVPASDPQNVWEITYTYTYTSKDFPATQGSGTSKLTYEYE